MLTNVLHVTPIILLDLLASAMFCEAHNFLRRSVAFCLPYKLIFIHFTWTLHKIRGALCLQRVTLELINIPVSMCSG